MRLYETDGNPVGGFTGFTSERATLAAKYPFGSSGLAMLRRCGSVLAEVLRGCVDPLELLFSEAGATAADIYQNSVSRQGTGRILGDALLAAVAELPEGRRLRVLEIGAGTGSGTAAALPELPEGRFDYVFTDISASFFNSAESRFGGSEASIDYRTLNIERDPAAQPDIPGIASASVEFDRRESWRSLIEGLQSNVALRGMARLVGLDGHGPRASVGEMKEDVTRAAASALALTQGLTDADVEPASGICFVTKGAQILDQSVSGEPAGSTLWGIRNVINRGSATLKSRMIELDPTESALPDSFIDELLFPDPEGHIAYRGGNSQVARMLRSGRLPSPPPPSVKFLESGMDSLVAVEIRSRLKQALASQYVIPNTVVFDYSDAQSLGRHLAEMIGESPKRVVKQERRQSP